MSVLVQRIGLSPCRAAVCVLFLLSQEPQSISQEIASQGPLISDTLPTTQEKLPRIVYTFNEQGELIPWVESFPWKTYNDLSRSSDANPTRQYVVTELSLNARAEPGYADISNKLELQVLTDGQFTVPIGMRECHFQTQPKITGEADDASVFARFDQQRNGYELVVTSKKDQSLLIEFTTQVVIKTVGDRTLLRMSLPRVPVSGLQLQVPKPDVVAGVADGMTVQRIESAATQDDDPNLSFSNFQVRGLLPNFELWWQTKQTVDVTESFAVDGNIDVTIDGLGEVSSVASLKVTSYNRPIDGFTVQLPKNTRWSNSSGTFSSDGYSISASGREGNRELLQVVFTEPAIQPPTVRFQVETEKRTEPSDRTNQHPIADFNVLGATTQSGDVRVFSEGDWILDFQLGDFARQTSTAASEQAEKTFVYSRPDQLSMVVTKQSSELIVEPIYIVDLEETVARLTAIFRCTRRGARRNNLLINLGPWIFQSLGPDPDNVIIDAPDLLSPTNGRLDIPLTIASDRFEVILMASLPLENGLASIEGEEEVGIEGVEANQGEKPAFTELAFNFPVALEAKPLQSTVALISTNTIALSIGKASEYSEISIPERLRSEIVPDANPLCFRMRAVGEPATLPVLAARLARSTSVDMETDIIDINQDRIRVRQRMQWKVSGVPLTRALLSVNEVVLNAGDLVVQINGQPVVYQRLPNFGDSASDEVTIQVPIEIQRLGAFELTLTYDWANWVTDGLVESWQNLDAIDVDLFLPKLSSGGREDRLFLRHSFRVPRVTGYKVSLDNNRNRDMNWPWQDAGDPDLEALSDARINILPIVVQQVTTDSEPKQFDELVDRAWFQTWYTDSERSDRAVFRVQGGDDELQVVVPTVANNLTVWVDREITDFRKSGDDLISISVDANQPLHIVELHYSSRREPVGLLKTSLPRIVDAEIMGQWYWHVVMPRNECMVTWPRNLTRAHHWDWATLVPRRESEMTLSELEEWSNAISSGGRVLSGSSQYLFGAMGNPDETLSVRTVPLPIYVVTMAGAVLVAGLLLIYTKRPAIVLVVLGSAIFGLIFLNPTYGSMAGQIAVYGIVLVLLGQVLSWLVNHSPRPKLMATNSRSSWVSARDNLTESLANQSGNDENTAPVEGVSSRIRSAQ